MIDIAAIKARFEALEPVLDERGRRLFAASEARAAGHGGVVAVSRTTGIARSTIDRGLADLLIAVTDELDAGQVFTGAPRLQLSAKDYYGGGGKLTAVGGLDSALAAIDEIAQQGEGRLNSNLTGDDARFEQPKEVAHYYRFSQILGRRFYDRDNDVCRPTGPRLMVDWNAVRPVGALNPKVKLARPRGVVAVLDAFTASYGELLTALHDAFNGKKGQLTAAVPLMQRLKNQAIEVMRIDIGGGKTCPPPFWFMMS